MKVGIISYDIYHAKTAELAAWGQANGQDVFILEIPFKPRPSRSPLIVHRPDPFKGEAGDQLYPQLKRRSPEGLSEQDLREIDFFVVGAAGLISENLIQKIPVLNTHSGWLPEVRGLDAFKWALYNNSTLGVTVHIIDERADAGRLVSQRETPIYSWDSLETLAYRHYRNEIDLLKQAMLDFQSEKNYSDLAADTPVTKRMPAELEEELIQRFPQIKAERAVNSSSSLIPC